MTDQKHTPEPWRVGTPSPSGVFTIGTEQRMAIAYADLRGLDGGESISEANARRIVACVNACEGISTAELELMTGDLSVIKQLTAINIYSDRYQEKMDRRSKHKQQRDKLMSFVEEYIEAWNDGMAGDSYLLRNAKELIAAVKGGAS